MNSKETRDKTTAMRNGTLQRQRDGAYRNDHERSHAQTFPPTFDEYPEMLTIAEACKALGVDGSTMHKLLENDIIRIDKDNYAWLIPRAALVAYVMENPNSAFVRSPGTRRSGPDGRARINEYSDDEY